MTKQEFAQSIKQKYPVYQSINDDVLADKMLEKYPVYKDKISEANNKNFFQRFNEKNPMQKLNIGVAKGMLSTLKGASSVGEKILQAPLKAVGVKFDNQTAAEKTIPERFTEPVGTLEKIGKTSEQIAEFFLPATKIAKTEKAVNLMTAGMSGLKGAATRIALKGAAQGTATAVIRAAQTGEVKQGLKAGAISGGIRSGMAIIGEGARALRIPERMYSIIFKNSKRDMMNELKSGGLQTLQQKNPQKFKQFVDEGIIIISKDGSPVLNDTMAEKALDAGLRGSIKNMADDVVEGTLESEQKVRQIAGTYKGTIDVSEPQIKNVLSNIADDYRNVGFGELADEATDLVNKISLGNGKVSATDAVNIKRLLDKVRLASSFDKPVSSLSQTQSNLKTLADAVRVRVNNVPGMGETMTKYSFYLESLETLGKEASKRGNQQILSLIDSLFISSGLGNENLLPTVTVGGLRKLFQSPWALTTLGSKLNQSNISPLTSGLISSGSAGLSEIDQ